jgi:hypothetical protein
VNSDRPDVTENDRLSFFQRPAKLFLMPMARYEAVSDMLLVKLRARSFPFLDPVESNRSSPSAGVSRFEVEVEGEPATASSDDG